MKAILEHIEALKKELDSLQPISEDNKARLDKKFRLEWNYNTNHIEGNTLTYSETELLLIFDKTTGDHEMREYEEMKSHDIALKLIQDLACNLEDALTEKFIRELNQILLVRPFYKEAVTPDGQSTRRLIKVGEYKSMPNSVQLQNGETFNYASPSETPALMNDLMSWYNNVSSDKDQHPIEVAAELHYRFVRIHPFDDGNGRISRLLMNYHLLRFNYPPVIIKSEDKKNYLLALNKADVGDLDAFKEYISNQLIWSLTISIKAAKSENIDEPKDWEKKIKLLQATTEKTKVINLKKTGDVILGTINSVFFDLCSYLFEKIDLFDNLFLERQLYTITLFPGASFRNANQIKEYFTSNRNAVDYERISKVVFSFEFLDYRLNGANSFNISEQMILQFNSYSYSIHLLSLESFKIEKYYHEVLEEIDYEYFMNTLTEIVLQGIDANKNVAD